MLASTIIFKEPLFPFKFTKYILTYKYANYKINKEDTIKEEQYRNINIKTADEWVHKYFGAVVSEVVECEYIGKRKGWHPDSEFVIHMPFCNDKKIFVESETEKVFTRDFDIATDPKFQHLYSEWVKKQVGIDDENVEFGFTGTFDEPYIDFDKITTLSEDCREVFENTHNLYAKFCQVKNITSLTEENKIEQAKFAREKYLLPAMNITGITKDKKKYFGGHIDLSNGSFKKNEDLCFTFVFDARISDSELIEKRYWN